MPADDGDEGIGTAPSLPAAIVLDDVIGAGLNGLGAIDEIALLTTPDEGHAAVPAAIRGKITDAVVRQCGRLKDRFGILQMPLEMGRNDPADVDPPISNSYAAVYLPLAQGFRPGGERHSPRPAGTTHSHNELNPRGIKNVRDFRPIKEGGCGVPGHWRATRSGSMSTCGGSRFSRGVHRGRNGLGRIRSQ